MEEQHFPTLMRDRWKDISDNGWAGYRLGMKLKILKARIRAWAKEHFGDVRRVNERILADIQMLDRKEEAGQLLPTEECKRLSLKIEFARKVREEEIEWKQRSRYRWLNDGDKNTRFFHGIALARRRSNRICYLWDGEERLEKREDIIHHIEDFFSTLYFKEVEERPLLDNLGFNYIGVDQAQWLEKPFKEEEKEEEVQGVIFDYGADKAPGPNGFPMSFF